MISIGIDLGTTASAIAVASNNCADIIKIDGEHDTIPSVVNYNDDGVMVGRKALLAADVNSTVLGIKRSMGTDYTFCGKNPVEISSEILSFIKDSAEKKLGEKIESAVITVPAHFSDLQRTATKQAASLAGIKVLRLVNEPTAAAIAFGLNKTGIFAVYDLGGGTFDFSILRVIDGVFQVLATGGDNFLGGNDVDAFICNENLQRNNICDLSTAEKNIALLIAKNMKENLLDQDEITAHFSTNIYSCDFILNRDLLNRALSSIIQKTSYVVDRVIQDAKVDRIDGVVLVGGMTKLPQIKAAVRNMFDGSVKIFDDIDPEKAVALGAALQAEAITNQNSNIMLIDVVSLSLGIETYGGSVDKLIYRNTPIPISVKREYTTYQDNQNGMNFRVIQGESSIAKNCDDLAFFELKGIPSLPAGMARVEVTFSVDINGILTVSAKEKTTNIEQHIVVEPSSGLSDEKMLLLLEKALKNKVQDNLQAQHISIKIDAERSIRFWRSILDQISSQQAVSIAQHITELEILLNSEKYDDVVKSMKKIEQLISPLLDDIISNKLKGKKIVTGE